MAAVERDYEFDQFRLAVEMRRLFKDGTPVRLSGRAFQILLFLVRNRHRTVSRKELRALIWNSEVEANDATLGTLILEVRKALGDQERTLIVTHSGLGYGFGATVKEILETTIAPIDPYATIKPLPLNYIDRPELLAPLRRLILGTTRTVALTAIQGMGGIGKTELARALCHDAEVRSAFPDGIIWVAIGRESSGTCLDRMRRIAKALNEDPSLYDADNCEERYRSLLIGKAVLIVLDNVWSKNDVEPFLADSPRCRVLFTTRNTFIAAELGAEELSTKLLSDEQARELLAKYSGRKPVKLPAAAQEIIRECGHLALGIREIGSALRSKSNQRWSDVLEKLRNAQVESLYGPTKVSVDVLGEQHPEIRQRYLQLAVLLEDGSAPGPILQTLWALDAVGARDTVDELENRSLVQRIDGGIRLHDLQLDYVRSEHVDPQALALIHQALRLSSHIVRGNATQFASQMIGRLLPFQERKSIREFLQLIRSGSPRPWLYPTKPCLTPPGGSLIRTLVDHRDFITCVAVSADGRRALAASHDKLVKVWDFANGRELTLKGHAEGVLSVAVTADGLRAVSASSDRTLKVWDLESGRELRTLEGHTGEVAGVALSADGRRAVSASRDQTLKVWDLESGREVRTLKGHRGDVAGVALSADGRRAVSASYDNTLKVWDLESGRVLRTLEGHTEGVLRVAMSADGRRAISTSHDRTLKEWDLGTGRELRTFDGHTWPVVGVAVSADWRRAVSASQYQTLKVWDLESGRELTLKGHAEGVLSVAVSADGLRAVSASNDRTLKVWEVATGRQLRTLKGHSDSVMDVAVSAHGLLAVSASSDRTLKVWDLESGRELRTLKGHRDDVAGVALSADGRRAVSASYDNTLKVWDLESGRELRTLKGHTGEVMAVALSADGLRAVSASRDRTLKVWDLERGRELRTLAGHSGIVTDVAVSANGQRAVSASYDNTLKVWDLESGRELGTLDDRTYSILRVAMSANGGRSVSASHDHTLKVWDLERGTCLATFTCDAPASCCAIVQSVVVAGDVIGHVHFLALDESTEISCTVPQSG